MILTINSIKTLVFVEQTERLLTSTEGFLNTDYVKKRDSEC